MFLELLTSKRLIETDTVGTSSNSLLNVIFLVISLSPWPEAEDAEKTPESILSLR